jgi:hypothetical protein
VATGAVPLSPVASILVLFPLIGLAPFTQYLVVARVSGLELSACFSGTSGIVCSPFDLTEKVSPNIDHLTSSNPSDNLFASCLPASFPLPID